MKIERVLLSYRKSLYQIYVKEHQEEAFRRALHRKDAIALRLRKTHETHGAAQQRILQILQQRKIEVITRYRANTRSTASFDLVISLGGDGTLLDTSHRLHGATPLLGINSDPQRSVGALCAGTADDLPALLDDLIQKRLRPLRVTRMRLRVDGQEVLGPTLNDVLFAHTCPAGLTRFDMAFLPADQAASAHSGFDRVSFQHIRGSGLWIATATGSTAAIRSAGGKPQPPQSRRLQFLVREPYRFPAAPQVVPHARGFIEPGQAMVLVSRMRQGCLWADGAHHSISIKYSQQVIIDHHPQELLLVRRPARQR